MVASGTTGTVSKASLVVGRWNATDLFIQGSSTAYHMGATEDCVLEITREVYKHLSNNNQRGVDAIFPTRAGMMYSGRLFEHHLANWNALNNRQLDSTGYIYPGGNAQCDVFIKVRARRTRSCDGFVIEMFMHKCLQDDNVSFGGGDEAIGSTFKFEAMDDSSGDYGGSAASPYGFIYLPSTPAATTA